MNRMRLISILTLVLLTGCAALKVVPYSQYSGEDKAIVEIKTNTLDHLFLQTYAQSENCTGRLRLDGLDGNMSSTKSVNYVEPNKPFAVTINGGVRDRLCMYSLVFSPEKSKKYELVVDLDENDFCVSSLSEDGNAVNSQVSDLPASGMSEQSPFCKGQTFTANDGGRIETSAYRFDSWLEQTKLKRKDK